MRGAGAAPPKKLNAAGTAAAAAAAAALAPLFGAAFAFGVDNGIGLMVAVGNNDADICGKAPLSGIILFLKSYLVYTDKIEE